MATLISALSSPPHLKLIVPNRAPVPSIIPRTLCHPSFDISKRLPHVDLSPWQLFKVPSTWHADRAPNCHVTGWLSIFGMSRSRLVFNLSNLLLSFHLAYFQAPTSRAYKLFLILLDSTPFFFKWPPLSLLPTPPTLSMWRSNSPSVTLKSSTRWAPVGRTAVCHRRLVRHSLGKSLFNLFLPNLQFTRFP